MNDGIDSVGDGNSSNWIGIEKDIEMKLDDWVLVVVFTLMALGSAVMLYAIGKFLWGLIA